MKISLKKIGLLLLSAAIVLSATTYFPENVYADDDINRTIKVGFFEYPGYHEINNGIKSGYGYDFLEQLKKYTNLNCEYVGYENSWNDMLLMLESGEIDMVTSARKTADRLSKFDFSEPIGTNSARINVRIDDERFIPGDFAALDGMIIGELTGNSRNEDTKKFSKEKGFTFWTKDYATAEELEKALSEKKVDAIATSSLRKSLGEKTVAEFAPENFYCIVRKGDNELLNEINYGIGQLDVNEENWRENLFYKNYGTNQSGYLSFTKREKDYISDVQSGKKSITVTAQPDGDPYSFVSDGKLVGIIPEYFEHLMNMAEIPYNVVIASDRQEFHQWVVNNSVDVVMDFRYGDMVSEMEDFGMVTDSYMDLTTSRVTRKDFTGPIRSIAIVESGSITQLDDELWENPQRVWVSSREEALNAVDDGIADACYVYTLTAQKYINTDPDSNLNLSVMKNPVYGEYIYVSPNTNHELASILTKCIKADTAGALDEYVNKYANVTYENINILHYLRIHPMIVIIVVVIFILFMIILLWNIFRARVIKLKIAQQAKLEESFTFTNYFLETYLSAYYVDLNSRHYKVYKRSTELDKLNPVYDDYYETLSKLISINTHPDDRKALLDILMPENMKKILADTNEYTHSFRDISGGIEKIYKMQIIRGADKKHAAFAFENITEELKEQQQRLLGAVPLSPDIIQKANIGLWAFELDAGKAPRMYVDDAMLKLIGLEHQVSPEETYHAWYDYIDEGSFSLVADAVEKMSSGTLAEVQYPWHHPNGDVYIVRCGGARNPEYKNGIRIEGTHQNVTDVVHYDEKEVRKNRDIIEILASEYTSVYYIDLTSDELTTYTMNESTESAFGNIFRNGISYSDAFKMYVDEQVSTDDKAMMLEAGAVRNIVRELSGKKTFITTYRDSIGHFSEMKFVKVGDEKDKPIAVALGFADKDEEIRTEMLRQEIAKRDQAVISGLSDDFGCVVYVDYLTGEEVHYRFDPLLSEKIPGWEEINNFDERIKTLGENILIPEDANLFKNPNESKMRIMDIVKREGVFYRTFGIHLGDEDTYYQLKLVRDEKSERHVIAGLRNIDETTKREKEYQEKLEAANKSKSDFLFNMSHDIRTPMNAIIGFTQMAKKHLDDKERTLDSLEKIESSGNHLLNLINEVLDMSRVEAGKLRSEMKVVNISDAAMKLVTICRENAAERNITLNFSDKNIIHQMVIADELHVNQVIMNILGNAVKYTLPGGNVDYTAEEVDSAVPGYGKYILTIKDNGIGMSPEFVGHIFESFAREDNATTSEIQGTGLGMSIVKRLVDYMDGTIDIDTKQGVGTTVRVTLHLKLADEQGALSGVNGENYVDLSGRKVLLVEDNELNREIATDILDEQGLTVETAVNGVEAIRIIKEKGPDYYDFVLMDIQMPIMNGYETTSKIRKMPGALELPIIALSANAFEEDKMKSLDAGMNDHVSKPIVVSELMAALKRVISR